MSESELLTIKQASERSGLSETAIRAAISRGKLAHTNLYGRILVAPADLDAYRATVKMGRPKKQDAVSGSSEL